MLLVCCYHLMFLKTLEKKSQKIILILFLLFVFFVIFPSLSWMYTLTEPETELQLLTDIDLLHIRGNGIRRGITRAIKQC